MARRGRPTAQIVLTDEQREVLERWARRPKSSQALALGCRIVLAAPDGQTSQSIAGRVGCHPTTVGKWRTRFAGQRLDGLHDEPRPSAPRRISDADVERVIVKPFEDAPVDATHWSTRSMAAATGMSQTAASRIWRTFVLKPHLTEDFKLSPDPQFIDKVRDVVGLDPAGGSDTASRSSKYSLVSKAITRCSASPSSLRPRTPRACYDCVQLATCSGYCRMCLTALTYHTAIEQEAKRCIARGPGVQRSVSQDRNRWVEISGVTILHRR